MMVGSGEFQHLLAVNPEKCMGCAHCIRKCPTRALRIRGGKASLRQNWCIDCGECLKVCPVQAIYVEEDDFDRIFDYQCRVALFPASFLGQFPEKDSEEDIFSALSALGFTHLCPVELTVDLIRQQMAAEIGAKAEKPQISPLCPAVVRLIQTKFPDLVDHIMAIRTPVETTAMLCRKQLADKGLTSEKIGIFYITPCAAKAAAITEGSEGRNLIDGLLNLDSLYNRVCQTLHNSKELSSEAPAIRVSVTSQGDMQWSMTSGEASRFEGRCFAVDGIAHVIEFLERLETTGELHKIDFLELRACDRGCVGGSLTPTNRFLAEERLRSRMKSHSAETLLYHEASDEDLLFLRERIQSEKPVPKTKLVYQGDIEEVLRNMDSAQKIQQILPGIDCGACGSPTCKSLSHDILRHEATLLNCIFMQLAGHEESPSHRLLEEVWGDKRFGKKTNE